MIWKNHFLDFRPPYFPPCIGILLCTTGDFLFFFSKVEWFGSNNEINQSNKWITSIIQNVSQASFFIEEKNGFPQKNKVDWSLECFELTRIIIVLIYLFFYIKFILKLIYHAAPVIVLHQFLWVSKKFENIVSIFKIWVRSSAWDFFPLYFFLFILSIFHPQLDHELPYKISTP